MFNYCTDNIANTSPNFGTYNITNTKSNRQPYNSNDRSTNRCTKSITNSLLYI